MAYNQNVPLANQQIKDTQAPIQNNFAEIQDTFDINHYDFDAPTFGQHLYIQMPIVTASPTTTTTGIALYNALGTYSLAPELWFTRQQTAGPTAGITYAITECSKTTTGWTRLPSGILLKWGSSSVAGGPGVSTYTYPVAATIPVFSTVFQVIATPYGQAIMPDLAITVQPPFITTTFTFWATNRITNTFTTVPFTYLAIGVG